MVFCRRENERLTGLFSWPFLRAEHSLFSPRKDTCNVFSEAVGHSGRNRVRLRLFRRAAACVFSVVLSKREMAIIPVRWPAVEHRKQAPEVDQGALYFRQDVFLASSGEI